MWGKFGEIPTLTRNRKTVLTVQVGLPARYE
jgi:hypothetical protein